MQIKDSANYLAIGFAIFAGATLGLKPSVAGAEDITWQEFNPPGGAAPNYGPPYKGAPGWRAGCSQDGDAAWYRFCQCPGAANVTGCTIGYYSIAPFTCTTTPSPIYLVTARGYTKTLCTEQQKAATKAALYQLVGTELPVDYNPPTGGTGTTEGGGGGGTAGGGGGGTKGGTGKLDVPPGEKPDEKTALKKDDTKTGTNTTSTETKETNQTDQKSNTQKAEEPPKKSSEIKATRDPKTGRLILDGELGADESTTPKQDAPKQDTPKTGAMNTTPQGPSVAGTPIDPKTVTDAQLKELLADPQLRSRIAKLLAEGDADKQTATKSNRNAKTGVAQKPMRSDPGISPEGAAAAGAAVGIGIGLGLGRFGGERMGGDR